MSLNWEVFMEDVAQMLNFTSDAALNYIKAGPDHHRIWAILEATFIAFTDEILIPYVRHNIKAGLEVTVDGFWSYLSIINDPNYHYAVEITLDGCTSTSNCHTFQSVGLENEIKSSFFILYPNPSNGQVKIESNSSYRLEVYDSKGSIVYTTQIKKGLNNIAFPLTEGLYIWKAFNETQTQSGKL